MGIEKVEEEKNNREIKTLLEMEFIIFTIIF